MEFRPVSLPTLPPWSTIFIEHEAGVPSCPYYEEPVQFFPPRFYVPRHKLFFYYVQILQRELFHLTPHLHKDPHLSYHQLGLVGFCLVVLSAYQGVSDLGSFLMDLTLVFWISRDLVDGFMGWSIWIEQLGKCI